MGILHNISMAVKKKRNFYTIPQYARFAGIPEPFVKIFVEKKTLFTTEVNGERLIPKTTGQDQRMKAISTYKKLIGVRKIDRGRGNKPSGFLQKVGKTMIKRISNSPFVQSVKGGPTLENQIPRPTNSKQRTQLGLPRQSDARLATLLPNLKKNIFLRDDEG